VLGLARVDGRHGAGLRPRRVCARVSTRKPSRCSGACR
jgi:hypothetical protein